MTTDRHVHRHYTRAELAGAERCIACGAAARSAESLDFAHEASTLYMTVRLPEVALCASCVSAQRQAMTVGKRALLAAYVVPAVLVVLVALTTPLDTPLVIPATGLAALVMARVVIALVRRARALDARVLYIDGAEDQIILQLRPLDGDRVAGYRALARELRSDGRSTKMRGARVRAGLGFFLSSVVTGVASLVGWFGAYPVLVIDDASGHAETARIDGKRVVSFRRGRTQAFPLSYGEHTITFGDAAPVAVRMSFGQNRLLSSDPERCYQVRWQAPATGLRPRHAESEIVRGPTFAIDRPDDVTPATCPERGQLPTWLLR